MTFLHPTIGDVIILSGVLRVAVLFVAAIAFHDVVRNGLIVRRVAWAARVAFYAVLLSVAASATASLFRIAGQSWAPLYRESAHCAVSVSLIALCLVVIRAKSVAGTRYSCDTGLPVSFTETGPTRDISRDSFVGTWPAICDVHERGRAWTTGNRVE